MTYKGYEIVLVERTYATGYKVGAYDILKDGGTVKRNVSTVNLAKRVIDLMTSRDVRQR